MRKYYCLLICFFLQNTFVKAQTIQQIDSVSFKMCETLSSIKGPKSEEHIAMVFQKHLPDFYRNMNVTTQAKADSLSEKLYFRLQKNCKEFLDLLTSLEENKSDWKTLTQKPECKIAGKDIQNFFKGGKFYYKEYNGKIVNVDLTPKSWTETFEDKTFSKLVFVPKKNGEFQLEFIESNNLTRKNLSVKGEVYNYGLYALKDGIFDLWVFSDKDKSIYGFRLYPKK